MNPFMRGIEQADYTVRNRLPMYKALEEAITFANRFMRIGFSHEGKKFLFATESDNLEALDLWNAFGPTQLSGLQERHHRLLRLMEEGKEYSLDELTEYSTDALAGQWRTFSENLRAMIK